MLARHGGLDGLGERDVADEDAELNVAVLRAEGEVGAGEQQDFVVDDDELGVADDALARRQLGGSVDRGSRELGLDLAASALSPST